METQNVILPLLLEVQQEVSSVAKKSKNPYFKSTYADYLSVQQAVFPVLNEKGIIVLQPTVVIEDRNYVNTRLIHAASGESVECFTEIIFKAGDAQAQGSGITYARRYGLMSLLALGAEDDDGNAANGRTNKPTADKNKGIEKTKIEKGNALWDKAIDYCVSKNKTAASLVKSYTIDEATLKELQKAIDERKAA